MTVLLDDSFGRANENPLGSPYAKPSGLSALELASNQVKNASSSVDAGAYHNITYDEDHWAETTFGEVTDGPNVGPCVRMSTAFDFYYFTSYNSANFFLFEVIGGSYNQVDASVGTYADNDVAYLEAQGDSSSTTVIGKIGGPSGTTVINYTDTTSPITGGRPGMLDYNGAARITRFRAGDFASGGPFTLDPTANVAVAGTLAVTGDVVFQFALTPTANVAVSGALSVTGETDIESEFGIDAPMLVSVAGTLATTGTLSLDQALEGNTVALTGALSLTGDLSFEEPVEEPFELSPTANVSLAGALSVSGTLGSVVVIAPTGGVAVSGAVSLAGDLNIQTLFAVEPTGAVAIAGSLAATGEALYSSVVDSPSGGWGIPPPRKKKKEERKEEVEEVKPEPEPVVALTKKEIRAQKNALRQSIKLKARKESDAERRARLDREDEELLLM